MIDVPMLLDEIKYDMCAAMPKLCLDCSESAYLEDIYEVLSKYYEESKPEYKKCLKCGSYKVKQCGFDTILKYSNFECEDCGSKMTLYE